MDITPITGQNISSANPNPLLMLKTQLR